MPYIKPEDRPVFGGMVDGFREGLLHSGGPGDLNYALTSIVDAYLVDVTRESDRTVPNYALLNEVIGVLECMKLELYRRVVAPYEDGKRDENGDVYTVPRG